VTRVGASECGQRASFKFNIRAFHDAVLELGSVPLPVVTARIDRFIAEWMLKLAAKAAAAN
jgi:uncharacterized protein (DUF885 family)